MSKRKRNRTFGFDIGAYVKRITSSRHTIISTGCRESQIDDQKAPILEEYKVDWCSSNIDTEYFKKMVFDNRPYYLFMTLTFRNNTSHQEICSYTTCLIHRFNTLIFCRNYKSRSDFIKGFAFFEKHMGSGLKREMHIHILIRHHPIFDNLDFFYVESKFLKAAENITDQSNRLVFNENCMDLQHVYEDTGVIKYCFEQIWDGNLDRIKVIDEDGLSDGF